jgi:N-acetylmuramoyl-L-alanine amidase-like protein
VERGVMAATVPKGFDRRHSVSAAQEKAWYNGKDVPLRGFEKPDRGLIRRSFQAVTNTALWVPQTQQSYAGILDHGIREVTHGIVIHVNAGYYHGTESFFTNGEPEPYGSQGVGAHFEIGGKVTPGIYGDGPPLQFLPLNRVAWHAVEANAFAIGMEHAGFGSSLAEWEKTHYNMIGNSAYRCAWILRRYGLGPPDISLTNPSRGNIWPHSCGGEAWGGHDCPGPYFPWDLWLDFANKAYKVKWNG